MLSSGVVGVRKKHFPTLNGRSQARCVLWMRGIRAVGQRLFPLIPEGGKVAGAWNVCFGWTSVVS